MKIAMIIPAYNEEITIRKTLEELHQAMPSLELWVVDNNSKDKTGEIATKTMQKLNALGGVLFEAQQGKANAVRLAFHKVDADYYGMIDADCTYPVNELQFLIDQTVSGAYDMVIGDRHSKGDYKKVMDRRFHGFGNGLVAYLINWLFDSELKDIMSGYRIFSRRFVKTYPIMCSSFELETEMSIHCLDKRLRFLEIPISFANRPEGSDSKLNTFVDGFKIIRTIFEIFKDYHPLKFFGFLFGLFFVFGLACGYPVLSEFFSTRYISHVPLAILATGFMVFSLLFLSVGLILDTVAKNQKFDFELKLLAFKDKNT